MTKSLDVSIYSFTIPNWHPTPLNKLINCHWAKAGQYKTADTQMIGVYAHKAKIPKENGKKRSLGIVITLSKGQRGCDPDAYYKSTCDALVRLGYLKNDSRQWVYLKPITYLRGEKSTTIMLEESI